MILPICVSWTGFRETAGEAKLGPLPTGRHHCPQAAFLCQSWCDFQTSTEVICYPKNPILKVIRDLISISRSFLCRMQIGRTEADSLLNSFIYSFAPSVNKYLIIDSLEKTLMLGKIEGRWRRGQQRMRWAGWHHRFSGPEFEQIQGDSVGLGSLGCCSPQVCKESDMT